MTQRGGEIHNKPYFHEFCSLIFLIPEKDKKEPAVPSHPSSQVLCLPNVLFAIKRKKVIKEKLFHNTALPKNPLKATSIWQPKKHVLKWFRTLNSNKGWQIGYSMTAPPQTDT